MKSGAHWQVGNSMAAGFSKSVLHTVQSMMRFGHPQVPHSYIRWCEGHPGALPHIPQMFERIKELRDAGLPVGTDNPPAPATPAKEGARPGRRRKAE